MRTEHTLNSVICLCLLVSLPALGAEIITEEDIKQEVIRIEQLVRLTDNAIFLFDTSSSMNEKFRDTGKSKLNLMISELKSRNSYMPDLGYNFGMYIYTPWKPIYELKPYDTDGVATALDMLPVEGSGPTQLSRALDQLGSILKTLSGKTVVFVFSDGQYTSKRRPVTIAARLAREHNVCFYVISTASEMRNRGIVDRVAGINECSRVIPFEYFIERPEYTTGALFEVKATAMVVTRTESRISGLDIDPLHFGFDSSELNTTSRSELDEVADFLDKNPGSYVVINGYSDNTGPEEYNLHLSRQRTESAAAYLTDSRGIDRDRIVLYWHGPLNPVASNATLEGRKQNRRLEMAVGGL
jgi:OOP family OmpA-OmpF porin